MWYTIAMRHVSPLADYNRFKNAVEQSSSTKEFLVKMGLRAAGGNFKQARKWSKEHGIPLPTYTPKPPGFSGFPDEQVFVENSTYSNRTQIKKRLLRMGWKYECSTPGCSVGSKWLGKSISLHLDHINGVYNDNRIENLRFLCPNCHSQTKTYAGRSSRKPKAPGPGPGSKPKIVWPPLEKVLALVEENGYSGAGRLLGVSDNAVRKHIRTRLSP